MSRITLRDLHIASARDFVSKLEDELGEKYSNFQVKNQLATGKGEVIDAIGARTNTMASKTENVEVLTALQLSDFYFPHEETEICFELKRRKKPGEIQTYEKLVSSIESATHVDCCVKTKTQNLSFQIKRYPQKYHGFSKDDLLSWIENDVVKGYGDMSGSILIIILQPDKYVATDLKWDEMALFLSSISKHTFDEVNLIYNDKGEYFVRHELFPKHHRDLIPMDLGLKRLHGAA